MGQIYPEISDRISEFLLAQKVIVIDVERVSDSCGYGVPLMSYEGDRDLLVQFPERKSPEEAAEYQATRNAKASTGCRSSPRTRVFTYEGACPVDPWQDLSVAGGAHIHSSS